MPNPGLVSRWDAIQYQGQDGKGQNDLDLTHGGGGETWLFGPAFQFDRTSQNYLEAPGDDFYPEAEFSVDHVARDVDVHANPGASAEFARAQ